MRNVLIASGEVSDLCRLIAGTLRPLVGNGSVSYYFGANLERMRQRAEFDLPSCGFLLLRLSPYSHQKDSATYVLEHGLIQDALRRRIPIGIVCDPSGKITAPYLEGDVLDLVKLVVTNGPNEGCGAHEPYHAGVRTFDLGLGGQSIADVAQFITLQLPTPHKIESSSPYSRQPQMAASNSRPANYTD